MGDAFSFRLEVLQKELDIIDSSVRKIDDIGNSIKNWAIITWAGSISVVISKPDLHPFLLFTAIPPIIFMFTDAYWRKIQRRFFYRQLQISNYLNSKKFEDSFKTKELDFRILDPIARNAIKQPEFKHFIAVQKILKFPTVSFLYIGLSIISVFIFFISGVKI